MKFNIFKKISIQSYKSSLIFALQLGHLIYLSNHYLIHSLWNICLHLGKRWTSSEGSKSTRQILPIIKIYKHSLGILLGSDYRSLKNAKLFVYNFDNSEGVNPSFKLKYLHKLIYNSVIWSPFKYSIIIIIINKVNSNKIKT